MKHPAASRRDRKKTETRARIVAAAIPIFAQRGIESATVEEIAAAADVGKGTIYNYFQTKEEIVVAFLVGIEKKVQSKVARYANAEGSLQELLVAFLEFQLRLKKPHYEFVRVFFAQMFARGSATSGWIQDLQQVIDPPLRQFFTTLQTRGMIRSDLELEDLVQLFKMLHVGLMTVWIVEGSPWRGTGHLLKLQVQMFCEGIQKGEERGDCDQAGTRV